MIVKFFGIMDIASAIVLVLVHLGFFEAPSLIFFIFYLFFKSVGYWGDINSYIEIICVIYMLSMFFGLRTFVAFVLAAYLAQKAIFSLIAN